MNRKEKIELLKQVAAGKVSLTKHRAKWWSQDWSDPNLFHCDGSALYSTTICPKDGIPADPGGEVFSHVLYYHTESIQFANMTFVVTDEDPYKVVGQFALYRQHKSVTTGKNFGLYCPCEYFDEGFIF